MGTGFSSTSLTHSILLLFFFSYSKHHISSSYFLGCRLCLVVWRLSCALSYKNLAISAKVDALGLSNNMIYVSPLLCTNSEVIELYCYSITFYQQVKLFPMRVCFGMGKDILDYLRLSQYPCLFRIFPSLPALRFLFIICAEYLYSVIKQSLILNWLFCVLSLSAQWR